MGRENACGMVIRYVTYMAFCVAPNWLRERWQGWGRRQGPPYSSPEEDADVAGELHVDLDLDDDDDEDDTLPDVDKK